MKGEFIFVTPSVGFVVSVGLVGLVLFVVRFELVGRVGDDSFYFASLFVQQFQLLSLPIVLRVLVWVLGVNVLIHLGVLIGVRLVGLVRGRVCISRIEIPPFFLHLQKLFNTPLHVRHVPLGRSVHPWQVGGRFRHGRPLDVDVCFVRPLHRPLLGLGTPLRILPLPSLSKRHFPLLVLPLHLRADDHQTPLSALCAILCAGDGVLVLVVNVELRVVFRVSVGFRAGGEAGEGREVWGA